MKRYVKSQWGLLSLEASICLTIFLFLMLFMYSFFVVFEARNQIGHVLLSCADSLALDAFSEDTLADDESLMGFLHGVFGGSSASNGTFTEASKWYSGEEADVQRVIKTRFLAYLSGGNADEANKILDQLNVVGGIDGLDFSKSKVEKDDLLLSVSYELDYEFKVFSGLFPNKFEQSCCSKLWK